MYKGIWAVMKKELARFFKDKRMCLTTLLLPGIMIYVIYSFMGDALSSQYTVSEDYQSKIQVVALPSSIQTLSEAAGLSLEPVDAADVEAAKEAVSTQESDALVIFPQAFDETVASYEVQSGTPAPNIEIYYNSASKESSAAYEQMQALLGQYENTLANKFDVNRGEAGYDLADEKDLAGLTFASLMPMLILLFLFSGCMAVAPESIAGEKERGTIATILVTPIRRSELALGKILSLSIIALLSGVSSTVGVLLSLPKLMSGADVSMGVYTANDYFMLGLVVLSTVLFLIALISIISAFAKTIKEAQTFITPLMMLAMVIGVTAMFGEVQQSAALYLIPLYGSVQSMGAIFSFDFNVMNMGICVIGNLVYTVVLIFILTRMFHSEKIIFSK